MRKHDQRCRGPIEKWCGDCVYEAALDYRRAIREAYEVWAGSELDFLAVTAPEAYALRVIAEMLEPLKRVIATNPEDKW